jgi:hypothetical protein
MASSAATPRVSDHEAMMASIARNKSILPTLSLIG